MLVVLLFRLLVGKETPQPACEVFVEPFDIALNVRKLPVRRKKIEIPVV